jgi:hypothetical protein
MGQPAAQQCPGSRLIEGGVCCPWPSTLRVLKKRLLHRLLRLAARAFPDRRTQKYLVPQTFHLPKPLRLVAVSWSLWVNLSDKARLSASQADRQPAPHYRRLSDLGPFPPFHTEPPLVARRGSCSMPQTNSNAGQVPRFGRAPAPLGAASWGVANSEAFGQVREERPATCSGRL